MRLRHHARATTLAALAAAALPAGAAAPWTAPATIPGAAGSTQSVVTRAGHGLVLSGRAAGPGSASAQIAAVTADGTVTSTQSLPFVASSLATYGNDRIVVAGRTLATSGPGISTNRQPTDGPLLRAADGVPKREHPSEEVHHWALAPAIGPARALRRA